MMSERWTQPYSMMGQQHQQPVWGQQQQQQPLQHQQHQIPQHQIPQHQLPQHQHHPHHQQSLYSTPSGLPVPQLLSPRLYVGNLVYEVRETIYCLFSLDFDSW
jgi:hypothetical protein